MANGQSQNEWWDVSCVLSLHRAQSYELRTIDFLFKRFLVLTLSYRSSQKKILCLSKLEDFQRILKRKWVLLGPIRHLYILIEEKFEVVELQDQASLCTIVSWLNRRVCSSRYWWCAAEVNGRWKRSSVFSVWSAFCSVISIWIAKEKSSGYFCSFDAVIIK